MGRGQQGQVLIGAAGAPEGSAGSMRRLSRKAANRKLNARLPALTIVIILVI
jgi:hypothetical protein